MDIPLPFGLVRGRLYVGVADSADLGRAPDMLGAIGEVDFTGTQTEFVVNSPDPSTIAMQKITGTYVAGILTFQGQEGVPLTANLFPDGTSRGWQWKVSYRVKQPDGTPIVLKGHNIDVPVYDEDADLDANGLNSTLSDLSKYYSPLPPSGNMQFVKGDKGDKGDPGTALMPSIEAGTGIVISGSGTTGDPFIVAATGSGGGTVDLSDYYTKEQADGRYAPAGDYVTQTEGDALAAQVVTQGQNADSMFQDIQTKAPKANPTLTGVVTIPTAPLTENSQVAASTAYVVGKFNALFTQIVGTAPANLDTLQEIATQLASDESAVSALTTLVGQKVPMTRTINGKVLSADITLAKEDISGITALGLAVLAAATISAAQQVLGIYTIAKGADTSAIPDGSIIIEDT